MEIVNIKDNLNFLDEVCILTQLEWGKSCNSKEEFDKKVELKKNKIMNNLENKSYAKLLLIDNGNLIGFISMFEHDCEERKNLTPWYATMYVKKEYRGKGYSKVLNDAILKEAKERGFKKLYLKSTLKNYYEKFGAKYIENLDGDEKLYYIDL